MPVLQPAEIWQESGRWDAIGERDVPPQGPQGRRHGPGHDPRRGRHLAGGARGPQLQAAPADVVPLPDQGARRGAAQERRPAHARVHHEGLLQPRRERRGAAGELPPAHRRLRPHLRALRPRLHDGRGRLGHDGRRRSATSTWPTPTPARTRSSSAASAATPPTSRPAVAGADPEPPASELEPRGAADAPFAKATGAPVDLLAGAELDTPDAKTIEQVAAYLGLPARAFIKALVVVPRAGERPARRRSRHRRPRHGARARRPRARRAQAAQGARRRLPPGDRRRGARGPGRRARLRRPRAHAAARVRRRGAAPGPLRRRRQQARLPPQRRHASSRCRRPRSPTCATRAPATRARSAPGDLEGARVIEVGNIFQLGTQVLRAHGRDVPGRGRQGASHRHGQLRHRPRAHRRRRRRAAPRRQRHLLAGEHRAVRRAPRAGARLGRRAARRSPTSCTRELAADGLRRRSTTTAT